MFGSRVEEGLPGAGDDVTGIKAEDMARAAVEVFDAVVLDLTADELGASTLVESMRMGRQLEGVATVGFYPHVRQEVRRRAEEAGIDVVVPRSRMSREAAAVLESALGG